MALPPATFRLHSKGNGLLDFPSRCPCAWSPGQLIVFWAAGPPGQPSILGPRLASTTKRQHHDGWSPVDSVNLRRRLDGSWLSFVHNSPLFIIFSKLSSINLVDNYRDHILLLIGFSGHVTSQSWRRPYRWSSYHSFILQWLASLFHSMNWMNHNSTEC